MSGVKPTVFCPASGTQHQFQVHPRGGIFCVYCGYQSGVQFPPEGSTGTPPVFLKGQDAVFVVPPTRRDGSSDSPKKQRTDVLLKQVTSIVPSASNASSESKSGSGSDSESDNDSGSGGGKFNTAPTELLGKFLKAVVDISTETDPAEATESVIRHACILLDCERATLFYVDRDELVLLVAEGAQNIRLPKSRGLAGFCASNGTSLRVADAWDDYRFDNSHDLKTGYRTKGVLCVPVRDAKQEIIAVLQCINKVGGGEFTHADQMLCDNLGVHTGIVLEKAGLFAQIRRGKETVERLLTVVEDLHSMAFNTHSLIFTLTMQAPRLLLADRATVFVCAHQKQELVVRQGDLNLRLSMSQGIAGFVAREGKVVNIPDCYADPRFNQAVDKKTGYRTRCMLCVPIFGAHPDDSKSDSFNSWADEEDEEDLDDSEASSDEEGEDGSKLNLRGWMANGRTVVGVLQLLNKTEDEDKGIFTNDDLKLLRTLLAIFGPILQRSPMYAKLSGQEANSGKPDSGDRMFLSPSSASSPPSVLSIPGGSTEKSPFRSRGNSTSRQVSMKKRFGAPPSPEGPSSGALKPSTPYPQSDGSSRFGRLSAGVKVEPLPED